MLDESVGVHLNIHNEHVPIATFQFIHFLLRDEQCKNLLEAHAIS